MKLRVRGSVLCVWEEKLLVVRLRDPHTKNLFKMPPGGMVEKGESPKQAALREVLEETGYDVAITPRSERVVDYPFVWAGEVNACRTHFFRGTVIGIPKPVSVAEKFLEGSEWLPLEDLKKEWSFHPQLRDALLAILSGGRQERRKRVRKTS